MNTQNTKTTFGRIMLFTLLAGAISIVINVILFFIGKAMGAFPETVLIPNQGKPFTVVPFIFSSMIPSIVAGLVMGLMNHFSKKPKKVFNIIALILVILTFINPFFIPGAPIMMIIILNIMHVVVAGNLMFIYNKIIK